MRQLSRSVELMFIFDLLVFTILTYCFSSMYCNQKVSILATVVVTVVGLFSLFLKGQYKVREHNLTAWNAYRLLEGVVFANIPAGILLFFFVPKLVLVKFLGLNILIVFVILALYRIAFRYYLFEIKKVKNILIYGADDKAKLLIDVIKNKYALKMNVVGVVKSAIANKTWLEIASKEYGFDISEDTINKFKLKNEEESKFSCENITLFEDGKQLYNICEENNVDIVIFTDKTGMAVVTPENTKIYLMSEFYEMATGKFYIDKENVFNLTLETRKREQNGCYDIFKRYFDVVSALIILIVTLPITALTALVVFLTDGKSPIYTQDRVGKDNKVFKCYKLRTMYSNDYKPKDNGLGYAENQEVDDRVIPFCKFVRKARFDEIPQMINILKGEMSIIGPRTEWKDVVDIYKKEISFYSARTLINTGWTGWAQINQGHCIQTDDIVEKLQYDLYYIKYRNVLWDLCILVKAVFLALGGRHK